MNNNPKLQFDYLDDLFEEIEQATNVDFAAIDDLCDEIDLDLELRKQAVTEWPIEHKRKEAVESQDPFVLNLLSMDENFNVRVLSACNLNTPINSLRRLAEESNDYIRMVVANNPSLPADILDRIAELTDEREVLHAVKLNPNTNSVTKYKIENR